jgi:hypothetical protein
MSGYHTLRTLRIVLWGAFLAALFLAVAFRESDGSFAAVVRYAPPAMLVLALLVGLAERIVRTRHGLPREAFLRPRSD